jgi:hypothetical protein
MGQPPPATRFGALFAAIQAFGERDLGLFDAFAHGPSVVKTQLQLFTCGDAAVYLATQATFFVEAHVKQFAARRPTAYWITAVDNTLIERRLGIGSTVLATGRRFQALSLDAIHKGGQGLDRALAGLASLLYASDVGAVRVMQANPRAACDQDTTVDHALLECCEGEFVADVLCFAALDAFGVFGTGEPTTHASTSEVVMAPKWADHCTVSPERARLEAGTSSVRLVVRPF